MAAIQALRADDFVAALGVNVHPHYGINDPTNAYAKNWLPLVQQLGLRHVRTGYGSPGLAFNADLAALRTLAAQGIDSLLVMSGPVGLQAAMQGNIPAPGAIESYNEQDGANPTGYASDLAAFQPSLYAAKALWPATTVLGGSLAQNGNQPNVGALTPNIDANNIHFYPAYATDTPYNNLATQTLATGQWATQAASGAPLWITETGLASSTNGSDSGVWTSDLAWARLITRTLLYLWCPASVATLGCSPYSSGSGGLGAARVYLYELLDEHATATSAQDRFGLYDSSLTLKQPGRTLMNTIALLSDRGPSFTPGTLGITATRGITTNLAYVLFQKRSGDWYLVFWHNGAPVSNPNGGGGGPLSGTDSAEANQTLTFTFDRTFASVVLYRPAYGGQLTQAWANTASVAVLNQYDAQVLRLSSSTTGGAVALTPVRSYFDSLRGRVA